MTAAAIPRQAVRTVDRVGSTGLLWLTLRQHRALLIATVAACAAIGAYLVFWRPALSGTPVDVLTVSNFERTIRYDVIAYSFVVAMFWGAPLLAREYEQRTNLLVWSQDVAPSRWLLTKATLLGGVVVVLAAGLELLNETAHDRIQRILSGQGHFADVYLLGFEANVGVQIGYALAAFTIGLAIGGLTRVPVVAMIGGAATFALIRWGIASYLRGLYLPTLDANSFRGSTDETVQELNVLHSGRQVEFAIYLGIAALALTFAWFGVRRRRHI